MSWGPKGDPVDLAVARTRNEHGALVYGRPIDRAQGRRVTRAALGEIYAATASACPRDLYLELSRAVPEPLWDALDDMLLAEEPTCQVDVGEFVTLGPLAWAVREAACLEIAHDALGCRINHAHRAAVGAMVRECGYVMAFRDLAVLCDRPTEIEWDVCEARLRFTDGTKLVLGLP